jgi:hypothetical protein
MYEFKFRWLWYWQNLNFEGWLLVLVMMHVDVHGCSKCGRTTCFPCCSDLISSCVMLPLSVPSQRPTPSCYKVLRYHSRINSFLFQCTFIVNFLTVSQLAVRNFISSPPLQQLVGDCVASCIVSDWNIVCPGFGCWSECVVHSSCVQNYWYWSWICSSEADLGLYLDSDFSKVKVELTPIQGCVRTCGTKTWDCDAAYMQHLCKSALF